MAGSDRLEAIFALIEGCKARGVRAFKGDVDGHVEFELAPLSPAEDPIMAALASAPKKVDPNKCLNCQAAPQERGSLCRNCHLGRAGVIS